DERRSELIDARAHLEPRAGRRAGCGVQVRRETDRRGGRVRAEAEATRRGERGDAPKLRHPTADRGVRLPDVGEPLFRELEKTGETEDVLAVPDRDGRAGDEAREADGIVSGAGLLEESDAAFGEPRRDARGRLRCECLVAVDEDRDARAELLMELRERHELLFPFRAEPDLRGAHAA